MRDGNIKRRRREATMILLNGDVARLRVGAVDLVFLLNHNCSETCSSSRVTKNVAHVVVAKHKRRTVKATRCVVSKNVHFGTAGFAFTAAQSGTRKGLVKQRNAQAVLEGGT